MCAQSSISWESVAAVIGAAAWLPTIWTVFQKTKIKGKRLSQYANLINNGTQAETVIVQKLSLLSVNNSFNLDKLEIFARIESSTSELKCTPKVWRNLSFTFNDGGNNTRKTLKILSNEWISQLCILPKDQAVVGYISFTLPLSQDAPIIQFRYIFTDFNGKKIELTIKTPNDTEATQYFDDGIWH